MLVEPPSAIPASGADELVSPTPSVDPPVRTATSVAADVEAIEAMPPKRRAHPGGHMFVGDKRAALSALLKRTRTPTSAQLAEAKRLKLSSSGELLDDSEVPAANAGEARPVASAPRGLVSDGIAASTPSPSSSDESHPVIEPAKHHVIPLAAASRIPIPLHRDAQSGLPGANAVPALREPFAQSGTPGAHAQSGLPSTPSTSTRS